MDGCHGMSQGLNALSINSAHFFNHSKAVVDLSQHRFARCAGLTPAEPSWRCGLSSKSVKGMGTIQASEGQKTQDGQMFAQCQPEYLQTMGYYPALETRLIRARRRNAPCMCHKEDVRLVGCRIKVPSNILAFRYHISVANLRVVGSVTRQSCLERFAAIFKAIWR